MVVRERADMPDRLKTSGSLEVAALLTIYIQKSATELRGERKRILECLNSTLDGE